MISTALIDIQIFFLKIDDSIILDLYLWLQSVAMSKGIRYLFQNLDFFNVYSLIRVE